jgi:hypothetical protein
MSTFPVIVFLTVFDAEYETGLLYYLAVWSAPLSLLCFINAKKKIN